MFTQIIPLAKIAILWLAITSPLLAQLPPTPPPAAAQEPPANDRCDQAQFIRPGEVVRNISNAFATLTGGETPAGQPATCIKTFENDLWYRFVGDSAYAAFEFIIRPTMCATPAGLQALIVAGDICESVQFDYRACANPYATEPIRIQLERPQHGQPYLLYIDGFDGNVCTFDLIFKGHAQSPPPDLRFFGVDYEMPPPTYTPENGIALSFANNEASVVWEESADTDVQLFLVERVRRDLARPYGLVRGAVEPVNTVDGGTATYRFTDRRSMLEDGETYCYRIVRVRADGSREYSEPMCGEARVVRSFFVSDVYAAPERPGYFRVLYQNQRRQGLTFSLLDATGKSLKSLELRRVKKGDFQLDIDLRDYPSGPYTLRVENGDGERYEREFVKGVR